MLTVKAVSHKKHRNHLDDCMSSLCQRKYIMVSWQPFHIVKGDKVLRRIRLIWLFLACLMSLKCFILILTWYVKYQLWLITYPATLLIWREVFLRDFVWMECSTVFSSVTMGQRCWLNVVIRILRNQNDSRICSSLTSNVFLIWVLHPPPLREHLVTPLLICPMCLELNGANKYWLACDIT